VTLKIFAENRAIFDGDRATNDWIQKQRNATLKP